MFCFKNGEETLGNRLVQTCRTISKTNFETSPVLDQLPYCGEEAYSMRSIVLTVLHIFLHGLIFLLLLLKPLLHQCDELSV